MRIAVLTSSRADYGIYLPLLKSMKTDPFFDLRLVVFGSHLSSFHGYTVRAIEEDGFRIDHRIEHILASDTPAAIASSMALAMQKFSSVWESEKNNYDLVLCLGDRYEMFAAVSAAAPFRIPFAHLHGGETTLGAIDNEFRHCISLFSSLHFVATEEYAQKVTALKGSGTGIHVVGSLSLDNLEGIKYASLDELKERFGIDAHKDFILVTYHPETASAGDNTRFALELVTALKEQNHLQVVITMPNADTMGNSMRKEYEKFAKGNEHVVLVENLGTKAYFACLDQCRLVVGNSSSGIIEAASFKKYVVNIGDRQKGRALSGNIIQSGHDATSIARAIEEALQKGKYEGSNIYYTGKVAEAIVVILKEWNN